MYQHKPFIINYPKSVPERTQKANLITDDELKKWHLDGLFDRSIDIVRIPNYFDQENINKITHKIKQSKLFGSYINAPKINRIGQAFFECQADQNSLIKYQNSASLWIKEMRKQVSPFLSPIDCLRLELSEIWPFNCQLAKICDQNLFAGLVREFKVDSYAEPHNDIISWDLLSDMHTNIINQLAANVYLQVPEQGGELRLWHEWPETKEDYNNKRIDGSYGVKKELLTENYIEVKPKSGELILFNSTRIHSVEKIDKGSRLTWSYFIGLENNDQALKVWS